MQLIVERPLEPAHNSCEQRRAASPGSTAAAPGVSAR